MRVALVGGMQEENLALGYLHAAVLEAGHDADLFGFPARGRFEEAARAVIASRPEIIGLSMVFSIHAREYVRFAELLRELGYPGYITVGGHFATLHATRLLEDAPAIDSVLHGEGEEALADLLRHFHSPEKIRGLSRRLADGAIVTSEPRCLPESLDEKAWPSRPARLDRYLGLPLAGMLGSRGCFAGCRFCSITAWSQHLGGPRFRQRGVDDLAAEMASLYHHRGVRIFNFHDDNFFLPRKEECITRFRSLRQRLDALGVGRIAIQAKSRPDTIDPEIVAALKELGCFRIFLGIESNSVHGLKALGRGIKHDQNVRALECLVEAGIHVTFNLLAFEPSCTLEDLRDNIAIIAAYPEVPLNICRTEIYAGTPLEKELLESGELIGDYFGYTYRMRDTAAQAVWEVFREVFQPRNFEGTGMNLRAMAVEYQLQLLSHFWPERRDDSLAHRVKQLIAEVNRSNADYLERACAFAETAPSGAQLRLFTARMCAERVALDEQLFARVEDLLREIEARSDAPPGDPETPGLSRGVRRLIHDEAGLSETASALLITLAVVAVVTVAAVTFFGDNIRALFGASTELAGEEYREVNTNEEATSLEGHKNLADFARNNEK